MRTVIVLCMCAFVGAICYDDDNAEQDNSTTTSTPGPKIKRDYNFDSVLQLPEIIINRAAAPQPTGGYHYPVPDFPVSFDEPSPSPIYGPPRPTNPPLLDVITPIPPTFIPVNYPPLPSNPPTIDLQPPQYDPIPTDDSVVIPLPPAANDPYLPPAPTATSGFQPQSRNPQINPVQMKISNMSCVDGSSFRYFKAILRSSHFLDNAPIIEDNTSGDCIFGNGDTFRIDLDGNKMSKCGVKYCSNNNQVNLCMTLRIPTVRFLKLPEDAIITLQCKVQDKIVSHTKHLRISPQFLQPRSTPMVATGGSQRNFETQVVLYRRAPGRTDFSQVVTPGSVVQLGEDLVLRASVREGDGWKYSRMGAVIMHRIGEKRLAKESVILVDNLGCRSATMRNICPEHPRQQSSLVTVFPIRAFMFQGANSGDEMVLSVRMLGCVLQEDCNQPRTCEDSIGTSVITGRTRAKREYTPKNTTDSWQSFVEFRVVAPSKSGIAQSRNSSESGPTVAQNVTAKTYRYAFVGLGILGLLICSVALLVIKTATRRKPGIIQ